MNSAAPPDPPDRGAMPPAIHDLGPLVGLVLQRHPLGGADQLAVHHSGGEWIGDPGHQVDGDLVELLEPLVDLTVEDRDACGADPPDHDGRHDTEA